MFFKSYWYNNLLLILIVLLAINFLFLTFIYFEGFMASVLYDVKGGTSSGTDECNKLSRICFTKTS